MLEELGLHESGRSGGSASACISGCRRTGGCRSDSLQERCAGVEPHAVLCHGLSCRPRFWFQSSQVLKFHSKGLRKQKASKCAEAVLLCPDGSSGGPAVHARHCSQAEGLRRWGPRWHPRRRHPKRTAGARQTPQPQWQPRQPRPKPKPPLSWGSGVCMASLCESQSQPSPSGANHAKGRSKDVPCRLRPRLCHIPISSAEKVAEDGPISPLGSVEFPVPALLTALI